MFWEQCRFSQYSHAFFWELAYPAGKSHRFCPQLETAARLAAESAVGDFQPINKNREYSVARERSLEPLFHQPQLVHLTDPLAVPDIAQMHSLAKVLQKSRAVDREAFAARVAHAVEDNAVRSRALQCAAERLRSSVTAGVIDVRHLPALAANVMEGGGDVAQVAAHVELHRPLAGGAQKPLAVVTGLRHRGREARRGIQGAEGVVGKAAAAGIDVCERRHDDGGAGPEDAVLARHELDLSRFVPQPRIGQGLEPVERFPVRFRCHTLEQLNGRKAARDHPEAGLPAHLADHEWVVGHQRAFFRRASRHSSERGSLLCANPARSCAAAHEKAQPRCASRYSRTVYRSDTLPESILSSADLPPNSGASFGPRSHSSAARVSGSSSCNAL